MKKLTDYIKESLLDDEDKIIDKKFCYKVGSYYDDGNIKGIVASLKEDGSPHLIISLDEPKDRMSWHNAMNYNNTLKDGWHIPSKDELEEVWHNDKVIDKLNKLNKVIKKYNGTMLNRWYWSSSCYDIYRAWYIDIDNANINNGSKGYVFGVRPFITLS